MLLSGAWGKVIHEKNQKQKISRHCPFKHCQGIKNDRTVEVSRTLTRVQKQTAPLYYLGISIL
jgi:hypothetical protein